MLRGQKAILRPVKRSDISCFLKWFNDPEVIQYLVGYLPMTEMAEEKWIEEQAITTYIKVGNSLKFIIEAIEDSGNKPIGTLGFNAINHKDQTAEFGIAIGEKDYWSRGYSAEAAQILITFGFQQLNLHRVSSSVFAFNERSLRLHNKIGFQEEGRLRQAAFKNGQFCDRVVFGLLRTEWKGY